MPKLEQNVDKWVRELSEAGWKRHATSSTTWISPWGSWYRGPFKAWQIMKSSVDGDKCIHGLLPEWCEKCLS